MECSSPVSSQPEPGAVGPGAKLRGSVCAGHRAASERAGVGLWKGLIAGEQKPFSAWICGFPGLQSGLLHCHHLPPKECWWRQGHLGAGTVAPSLCLTGASSPRPCSRAASASTQPGLLLPGKGVATTVPPAPTPGPLRVAALTPPLPPGLVPDSANPYPDQGPPAQD